MSGTHVHAYVSLYIYVYIPSLRAFGQAKIVPCGQYTGYKLGKNMFRRILGEALRVPGRSPGGAWQVLGVLCRSLGGRFLPGGSLGNPGKGLGAPWGSLKVPWELMGALVGPWESLGRPWADRRRRWGSLFVPMTAL